MYRDGKIGLLTTTAFPLTIINTQWYELRRLIPADRVVGLDGLTMQARRLSRLPPQPPAQLSPNYPMTMSLAEA